MNEQKSKDPDGTDGEEVLDGREEMTLEELKEIREEEADKGEDLHDEYHTGGEPTEEEIREGAHLHHERMKKKEWWYPYAWGPVSLYPRAEVVPDWHPVDPGEEDKFYLDTDDPRRGAWMEGVMISEPWDKVRQVVDKRILPFLGQLEEEPAKGSFGGASPASAHPQGQRIKPDLPPLWGNLKTAPRISEEVVMWSGWPGYICFGFAFQPRWGEEDEGLPSQTTLYVWWYLDPRQEEHGTPAERARHAARYREWIQEKAVERMGGGETVTTHPPNPWDDLPDVEDCGSKEQAVKAVKQHLIRWLEENPDLADTKNGFPHGTLKRVCKHLEDWGAESTIRKAIQLKRVAQEAGEQ